MSTLEHIANGAALKALYGADDEPLIQRNGALELRSPLHVIVYGSPAPQGSKRHVGNGVMVESCERVKPWRQDVVAACVAFRERNPGACPARGPLYVRMVFTLPKPKSAPKRKRTYPDRKPDLSKLVRSTEDAMVTAGLIEDDARIVRLDALKAFPSEDFDALASPGVQIWVSAES